MTPHNPRSRTREAIDPRTGKHIAAPDTLWWTCTWIAAVVLSAPLLAWAGYTFWMGEFYWPHSRRAYSGSRCVVFRGVSALLLSTCVLLAAVGVFLRVGVREIDALRGWVDRAEQTIIVICVLCISATTVIATVQTRP